MKLNKKVTLTIPINEIEEKAQEQIEELSKINFLEKLVILPDVHAGYDMPIGGVALLDGYISPSFVGYDIGCSMMTSYLNDIAFNESPQELYEKLNNTIKKGTKKHDTPQADFSFFDSPVLREDFVTTKKGDTFNRLEKVRKEFEIGMGTLGGGNHFIEIGSCSMSDQFAVTIHSGSRNAGWHIADCYMNKGRFFPVNSPLGKQYFKDMQVALYFSYQNKLRLMKQVLGCMGYCDTQITDILTEHTHTNFHNFAEIIPHTNKVLHRKGATPAKPFTFGIIPGTMGDGVYITTGGPRADDYLNSSSHGAGRVLSRRQAKKTLSLEEFQEKMIGKVAKVTETQLDESPMAYKDIHSVIQTQVDLGIIKVVDYINSIITVKG